MRYLFPFDYEGFDNNKHVGSCLRVNDSADSLTTCKTFDITDGKTLKLVIDTAGDGHCTPIFSEDRQSGCWDVTYTSRRVCALDLKDLRKEHQFAGRVEYVGNKLRIKDLRINDSGEYQFIINTDFIGQYSGSPGVILTVTSTLTKRSPITVLEEVIISCSTNCTLNSNTSYIWYKNGRQVTDGFTKVNKLYLDSVSNEELQQYSCAVGDPVDTTVFSHYTVTLLVFLPQFLIIAALWMWKSSSVSFIVCVNLHEVKIMNSRLSALILLLLIPGMQTERSPAAVSEEEDVILSCSTKCTLNDNPTYIWYKNGRQVTDGFTKVNKLYLDSVSNEELQQYSCAVGGFVTLDQLSVTCSEESICAMKGSEVTLTCSYSNINIKTVFWFSEKQNTNWRKNNEPEDLTLDSDYSGRVKHQISNSSSTLTISDVRERDSGEYQLMFIMNDGVKHLRSAAVSLTVTDLHLRMNPVSTDPTDERLELTCDTSCTFTSEVWYYWMKNGRHFKHTQDPKIFVSHSVSQSGCWDVTYTSTRVCALVNSTVDISCTYSHPSNYTVNKTFWYYGPSDGPSQDFKDLREEHQFAGRVEYVGNKLRIKDLKFSDSGEYRFIIITDLNQYSGSPGVILTVTGTQIKRSSAAVSEGQEVILSCSTNCTLNDKHTYIWYKNGRQVTDGFTKVNKLYLDSVSNEELQQYSCAVGDSVDNTVLSHFTVTLLVFLPQFLIIAALWMWKV
ncbi:sialoadhesin-like isoform X1 [Labeo rohita]|uniref:Sialoadhesin-like isoform X1 n=1 Tax=Labeo rohita TaxID=84645 RepID=A0A498MAZ8_LABRO|nr:sialoadhesin-like isoform X1 [Labeo rohita]